MKSLINDSIKDSKSKTSTERSISKNNISNSNVDDINSILVDIINKSRTKIFVIGAGGAGNNTISRLGEIGIEGAETISINTDAQDLFF